jgi:AraC-like DNA-binding protein
VQTSLATIGQIVKNLCDLHGFDPQKVFDEAGVSLDTIRDPNARIPAQVWDHFAHRAAAYFKDPAFALRAAHCWHPSNLGALGFAWLSSSTLRTGLERVVRYWRLLGEKAAARLEDTPVGLKIVFESGRTDPVVGAITADFTMSLLVSMCRMNYGDALRPVTVSLKRARPDGWQVYRSHYGCPVRFAAGEDSFTLARAHADKPLPTSNRQIAATLDAVLTRQLAQLDKTNVVARCRASLLEQLSSGELSEEEMAQQLHMSRRTLQRKLAEAETTYQQLVDATRRDLALRYIENPHHSITDITFMLGFSQHSAFTRAFRRWTGIAPSEYRQRGVTAVDLSTTALPPTGIA